ncbi:hypothetical protein VOM14_16085 [Paraburkholderia sp. MPAMCS5]|uniref:hypothetical protein n=1 Tax=Paraburkholderia sp. MPAMCS5 TaxID=3112563 RepID=UPI002E18C9D2|nr:hypothetical protein [Paraburkholderia sp. MPAMCS5]
MKFYLTKDNLTTSTALPAIYVTAPDQLARKTGRKRERKARSQAANDENLPGMWLAPPTRHARFGCECRRPRVR